MSVAAKRVAEPRYGSVAELASYAGLSPKTIRRLIGSGAIRGLKVGRRVVIPFEDLDRYILRMEDHCSPTQEAPTMATVHRPTRPNEGGRPYVPTISPDERARRNREAIALLDSWATEGDEEEQRETMAVLREALGENRSLSSRALFP